MSTPKIVLDDTIQVIMGTVLGDSHIRKEGSLSLTHCPNQLDYLKWKLDFLVRDKLASGKVYTYKVKTFGNEYYTCRAESYRRRVFKKIRVMFYGGGKKKVTRKLLNKLSALGLAVWYMDDGSKIIHRKKNKNGRVFVSSREICINTHSFSMHEHQVMQQYFKVVWDIEVKIYKSRPSQRLVMNATNANKFIDIIRPYVIPCMEYKVDLEYVDR